MTVGKGDLEISDIRVHLLQDDSKVKALVSLVLGETVAIHGIKVIEGTTGLFVAMPSRKTKDNEYKDIVHPITNEFRQVLHDTVLEVYKEMTTEPV